MDRFTSDFDRIFRDRIETPRELSPEYLKIKRMREDILAQKAVEGSEQARAAASRFTAPDKSEASPTRTGNPTEIQND